MATVEATTAPPTGQLLAAEGVTKAFGPTQALRDAALEVRAGEAHALMGENGSGKSTLVKILSGVHTRDGGTIRFDGSEDVGETPRAAQTSGVSTVFQEVLVAEARSVLDNVWLGADTALSNRVSTRDKRRRAKETLSELLGYDLELDRAVEELSLSERQACCIVRALLRDPKLLILDEATSSLDIETRDRLFKIVARLKSEGVGVVVITHRMDELADIIDRITVMRSGRTVATLDSGNWTTAELVRLMTGSEQLTAPAQEVLESARGPRSEAVMSVKGLVLAEDREPFDVTIHAGELIGVAGLEGHGQDQFLHALRGVPPVAGVVTRHTPEGDIEIGSREGAARQAVAYVPRERGHAIFTWMSIRENFGMPTLRRDTRGGWLSTGSTRKRFSEYVDKLNVVLGTQEDRITTLSGGNQQKVVIARWLAADPRVLVLNDPTRGIDIGAKTDLYKLLGELADEGLAVVMLSTELDEQVELMDRVLVFREHKLFEEIPRASLSRDALVSAFFGETKGGSDGGQ